MHNTRVNAFSQEDLKQQVALAAVEEIRPYLLADAIIGVGTGSTADLFIDALAKEKYRFAATVASSERSARRLESHGIKVLDLNAVERLPVYVDGADEINADLEMIKGGGAALTREKIVAAVAERFVCIADASKLVATLGQFPLPVEVIPMAHAHVKRRLLALAEKMGQKLDVRLRLGTQGLPLVTDNGNYILDVHGLEIAVPIRTEAEINMIVGVVVNGLFAARPATVLLLGTQEGVKKMTPPLD